MRSKAALCDRCGSAAAAAEQLATALSSDFAIASSASACLRGGAQTTVSPAAAKAARCPQRNACAHAHDAPMRQNSMQSVTTICAATTEG
jgi:hypothetical protein